MPSLPSWNSAYFYPRSPCGERRKILPRRTVCRYFYPRSPCGERRLFQTCRPFRVIISIHALLAESDCNMHSLRYCCTNFYPRSPCGERRIAPISALCGQDFYPRSPCGERHMLHWHHTSTMDFYPRSPCGERLLVICGRQTESKISIHALLAESDCSGAD